MTINFILLSLVGIILIFNLYATFQSYLNITKINNDQRMRILNDYKILIRHEDERVWNFIA